MKKLSKMEIDVVVGKVVNDINEIKDLLKSLLK